MYFFFNLTITSPERSSWYYSAVFIGSCFTNCLLWLQKPHCICLEQNSIGKRPRDFEASGFPSCIFETTHGNQKKSMMSGKVGTFSKQNGICKRYFFIMRILCTKLKSYILCYRQAKWYMQKIPSVTGIICAKCQNYNICM